MTVIIGNVFEAQHKGGKGWQMQEISLMKNIIHGFMNNLVVKKLHQEHYWFYPSDQSSSSILYQEACCYFTDVYKKDEKYYLFFNYERPDVDSLEYSDWVFNLQNIINNSFQIEL